MSIIKSIKIMKTISNIIFYIHLFYKVLKIKTIPCFYPLAEQRFFF